MVTNFANLKFVASIAKPIPATPQTPQMPIPSLNGVEKPTATAAQFFGRVKSQLANTKDVGQVVVDTVAKAIDKSYFEIVQAPFIPLAVPDKVIRHLDEWQTIARNGVLENQFSVVIGAAGTGKTFTMQEILREIEASIPTIAIEAKDGKTHLMPSLVITAFTGRAVQQSKRQMPAIYHDRCGTIHGEKVLAYVPEFYEAIAEDGSLKNKVRFIPSYNELRKMPIHLFIIDEAGMLSVELWNILRRAMLLDARVIMVGDINQLPPVFGKSVLGFAMQIWPTYELKTVHRQALDSPIISNAHNILQGKFPLTHKGAFDLVCVGKKGSLETQQMFLKAIKFLHQKGEFNPQTDTAIVPMNVKNLGQETLNSYLAPYFNPAKDPIHNAF